MDKWINLALKIGFTAASSMDITKLAVRSDIRAMCEDNRCNAYEKNWTCPPACGTLEECLTRMQTYHHGILLQTVGHMQKAIDSRAYRETEQLHLQYFYSFSEKIKKEYPNALCLGSGGCRICKTCAYPAPCRFPDKAYSSMEGYGLFVTQVCRDNQLPYYYGSRTIAYTACVLF